MPQPQPWFPFLVTGTYILNQTIFQQYGGDLRSSLATGTHYDIAFMIAEQFAMQEIGTFLTPITVTGTFPWPQNDTKLMLPTKHVRSIASVTAIHEAGCDCADDSVELSGCAWLLDGEGGIVDLRECAGTVVSNQRCSCSVYGKPIQLRIVYEAGIAAGLIAANPSVLMGLVTAADLALEQLVDSAGAEGGPGDPSVSNFSDTGYSETRQFLVMTAFGGSPRANFAARMLKPLKYKRALRL